MNSGIGSKSLKELLEEPLNTLATNQEPSGLLQPHLSPSFSHNHASGSPNPFSGSSHGSPSSHDCSCSHSHSHDYVSPQHGAPPHNEEVPSDGLSPFLSRETNQQMAFSDKEEEDHFKEILGAFFNYKLDSYQELQRIKSNFDNLPEEDKALLEVSIKERIMRLSAAVESNFSLVFASAWEHADKLGLKHDASGHLVIPPLRVPFKQVSKMRSTLKQFAREWSKWGEKERRECFDPLLEAVQKHFPIKEGSDKKTRVLCPGSGLGRLPLEFVKRGYSSQGNEFSYFMLLSSDFILNTVQKPEVFTIYPFIHNLCNKFKYEDALIACKVPDISPSECIPPGSDFSMVAGEFVECYSKQVAEWDAVATCFFIDTAHNIIEYIRTIFLILKPGGIWTNIGPLLYHYAEMYEEISIELSWEEVRSIIVKVGFEIISEGEKRTTYCADERSMMTVEYDTVYFTAKKPI